MQAGRGEDEADRIADPARALWQLRSMGVAMEDREDGACGRARRQRRRGPKDDGQPENDDGDRDAGLDAGQVRARHAPPSGRKHHGDEGERISQPRPAAGQPGPEADRDHGEQVVEPGQGMEEARAEAVNRAYAGVSKGRAGDARQDHDRTCNRPVRHRRYPSRSQSPALKAPSSRTQCCSRQTPASLDLIITPQGARPSARPPSR